MRARSVLAAVAVIALVAAPAANAKSKPRPPVKKYCNLLQDKPNDGNSTLPMVGSSDLDIVSGDLSTGPKTMVAVLRIAGSDFNLATDHWGQALGYGWTFGATSNYGQKFTFSATLHAYSGTLTGGVAIDSSGVAVKSFKFDPKAKTFTWVIDRSVDKTLTRKSTVFKQFRGESTVFDTSADHAPDQNPTSATYPDRGLSCVHAD